MLMIAPKIRENPRPPPHSLPTHISHIVPVGLFMQISRPLFIVYLKRLRVSRPGLPHPNGQLRRLQIEKKVRHRKKELKVMRWQPTKTSTSVIPACKCAIKIQIQI